MRRTILAVLALALLIAACKETVRVTIKVKTADAGAAKTSTAAVSP